MKLKIESLTEESFAPYGKVIQQPNRPLDAEGPGWSWWGETAYLAGDARPYGIGYLDLRPAELSFDWAERHMNSMEMLIPAGGDCLVYVAPPDFPDEPGHMPGLDQFKIFRVCQGQAVLLQKGVWHGAPLAVDTPLNVVVLLHKDTGSTDTSLVRFDQPVWIEREG